MDTFRHLANALQDGDAVLATVVQTKGSVPREIGAKMIVCSDGEIFGTIGGGAGEAKVIQQAKNVLQTGIKQLVEIDLTSLKADGICGGKMQVWLECWDKEQSIDLANQIFHRLESGQTTKLVTPLTQQGSPYLLADNAPAPRKAFVECLPPPPTLLIVGAGHVGIELAKVAKLIGFQIIVQDNRPEWAKPENFPEDAKILTQPISEVMAHFEKHEQLYVALVTRGYQYDLEALPTLLKRERSCRYIGMIGSEKRVRQVFQTIEQMGIEKEKLATVYAPIGLDIGALMPTEIAVSIAAELIMVRRGGSGKNLSIITKAANY